MRVSVASVCGVVCLLAIAALPAQEREDRTLLPREQMPSIINEASGERAMHHVLELVPYQRVRPLEEYTGTLPRERGDGAARQGVRLQQRPHRVASRRRTGLAADGRRAVDDDAAADEALRHPRRRAVAGRAQRERRRHRRARRRRRRPATRLRGQGRHGQVRPALRAASAPLRAGAAARRGRHHAAYAVLAARSTIPIRSSRSSVAPPEGSSAVRLGGLAARQPRAAARCSRRGEKVTIRSIVKASRSRASSEIVHAEIPGDGSTTQEVAIGGHLYEGVIKQGANDDNSGCALTLEIGRAYLQADQGREAAEAEAHDQLPVGRRRSAARTPG